MQEKQNLRSDINFITSSHSGRKNIVFAALLPHYILFKRSFITDHSLLREYNLYVYQKSDLETNTAF